MTRILADLPDEDIKWLDQLAAEQGKSRASILREAFSFAIRKPLGVSTATAFKACWRSSAEG